MQNTSLPVWQGNNAIRTKFFFYIVFNFIQIVAAWNRLTLWTRDSTNLEKSEENYLATGCKSEWCE